MKFLSSLGLLVLVFAVFGSACAGSSSSATSPMQGGSNSVSTAGAGADSAGRRDEGGNAGSSQSCNIPREAGCAAAAVSSNVTTGAYTTNGTTVTFSDGTQKWTSYTYASSQQSAPVVVAGDDRLSIHAEVLASDNVPGAFVGVGLYFNSPSCADVSAYRAITFDLSGNLGGCIDRFFVEQSADIHADADHPRGQCTDAVCYGPSFDVAASGTVTVPLSDLNNGVPCPSLDPRRVLAINWLFRLADDATSSDSCTTSVVVSHVRFIK